MTKPGAKALFSRSEVARLFHVSPITVTRWAEQGKLPYQLTLGGQRRYPREGTMAILSDIVRRAQATKERARPGKGARTRDRT
jgi:predicted site-specific integrase-resolvase